MRNHSVPGFLPRFLILRSDDLTLSYSGVKYSYIEDIDPHYLYSQFALVEIESLDSKYNFSNLI